MKFDNITTDVDQIGDIVENKVTVDAVDLDFILSVVTSKFYSDPAGSFIREITSNAWDSHVEAGIDDPILIVLGKDTEGNYYCKIEDFGVGISPERFESVYRKAGKSNRRHTDDFIGGFGLGKFSGLAYSDVVYITSIHDKLKYDYIMYKDGNKVFINLLNTTPIDQRNGVSVTVHIKNGDLDKFDTAIRNQLVYFENLYVVNKTGELLGIEEDFTKFKIKKYKNFAVNNLNNLNNLGYTIYSNTVRSTDLTLGKVRYPLKAEYRIYCNITLTFDIGELDITPNREEIQYTQRSIDAIRTKNKAVRLEIDELIQEKLSKDYDDLQEYKDALNNTNKLRLLEDESGNVDIGIVNKSIFITYKGKNYTRKEVNFYHTTINNYYLKGQYVLSSGKKLISNTFSKSIFDLKNAKEFGDSYLYLGNISSLKNITKAYIRDTFDAPCYFSKPLSIATYYKEWLKEVDKQLEYKNRWNKEVEENKELSKIFFKYYLDKLKNKLKVVNDDIVTKEWLEERKKKQAEKRKNSTRNYIDWKQNIKIYKVRRSYNGYRKIAYDAETVALGDLETKYKKLTIYSKKDNEDLINYYRVFDNKINIVVVAPTKVKLLKDVKNFVNVEDFINTDYKIIRKLGTYMYLMEKVPHIKNLNSIQNLGLISNKLATIVRNLNNFINEYSSHYTFSDNETLLTEIYNLCKKEKYFDNEIKSIIDSNYKMLHNSQFLLLLRDKNRYGGYGGDDLSEERINLAINFIMARRLFIPNISSVKKMKEQNTLIY